MMRLSYLIPRLIILGLVTLALWLSKDSLIKRAVVSNLEDTIGAKVEIGEFRASIGKRKLFIKDLAIADPKNPMKNLFQADMAYVDLDADSLLHRRIVINNSETSNVVFGAPRLSSGALKDRKYPVTGPYRWEPKLSDQAEQFGLQWLDKLPRGVAKSNETNKSTLEVIGQYSDYWPTVIAQHSEQIVKLETNSTQLKALARLQLENPLRPAKIDPNVAYSEIYSSSDLIQKSLNELTNTLAANRLALQNAYQRDLQALRTPTSKDSKFDHNSINQLLLAKSEEKQINEIIGWFHWFRQTMPDAKADFRPVTKRGQDLKIPQLVRKPGFLVRSIDLEGNGRFANQHTSFAGTAYNLSNEPEIHDEPASFVLRAQGNGDQHVMLNCVLDRRGEKAIDTMNIVCPELDLESQTLGEKNSIQITLGPSRIQAEINLQAIDDQLSGDIVFRHSNVSLHVDRLNELAGGQNTALQLNQGLASIDRFVTKATLSGTLDDFHYVLRSDLGEKFALAADSVVSQSEKKLFAKRKLELDQILNSELQKIDNQIAPKIEQLKDVLNNKRVNLATLKDILPRTESLNSRPVFR